MEPLLLMTWLTSDDVPSPGIHTSGKVKALPVPELSLLPFKALSGFGFHIQD